MKALRYVLEKAGERPTIWAAWGNIIEKRPYLKTCLKDIISIAQEYNARWVITGKVSKNGHPHHPLYLSSNSEFEDFDISDYE